MPPLFFCFCPFNGREVVAGAFPSSVHVYNREGLAGHDPESVQAEASWKNSCRKLLVEARCRAARVDSTGLDPSDVDKGRFKVEPAEQQLRGEKDHTYFALNMDCVPVFGGCSVGSLVWDITNLDADLSQEGLVGCQELQPGLVGFVQDDLRRSVVDEASLHTSADWVQYCHRSTEKKLEYLSQVDLPYSEGRMELLSGFCLVFNRSTTRTSHMSGLVLHLGRVPLSLLDGLYTDRERGGSHQRRVRLGLQKDLFHLSLQKASLEDGEQTFCEPPEGNM